jgi:hypothetical protein
MTDDIRAHIMPKVLRLPLVEADKVDGHNDLFPRATLEHAVENAELDKMWATVGFDPGLVAGLEVAGLEAAGLVEKLEFEGNVVMASVRLLDTPMGVVTRNMPDAAFCMSGIIHESHQEDRGGATVTVMDKISFRSIGVFPEYQKIR